MENEKHLAYSFLAFILSTMLFWISTSYSVDIGNIYRSSPKMLCDFQECNTNIYNIQNGTLQLYSTCTKCFDKKGLELCSVYKGCPYQESNTILILCAIVMGLVMLSSLGIMITIIHQNRHSVRIKNENHYFQL